jgi:hypothetical protein
MEKVMARPKLGEGDTQRLQLKISDEELKAIEDWRFANRVSSRSEAVRRLIQIALALEPLVEDLPRLSREVRAVDIRVRNEIRQALDNPEWSESYRKDIEAAFNELEPAVVEFMAHAGTMAKIFEALRSGSTVEESVEKIKDSMRELATTRAYVRRDVGGEE